MFDLAAIILAYCLGFRCGLAYQAQTQGWFLPRPETIDLFQQAETRHAAGFHADETLDEQFRVFWEAWISLMTTSMVICLLSGRSRCNQGMVASLGDEHTLVLTPQEAAILSSADSGRFEESVPRSRLMSNRLPTDNTVGRGTTGVARRLAGR